MSEVDQSLLYQEIPIYSNLSHITQRCKEISVEEASEGTIDAENCSFPDAGGGIKVSVGGDERNVFWRTHGDVLELQERSLNFPVSVIYRITFRNSKALPSVHISPKANCLHVLCGTLHGVHRLVFDLSTRKANAQSIFHSLGARDFSDPGNSFYFNDVMMLTGMNSAVLDPSSGRAATSLFALISASGNINLVRMPASGPCTTSHLEASSRVTRLLRGINPWSSGTESEAICSVAFAGVNTEEPKILVICKDYRVCVWSCKNSKSYDHLCQLQMSEYVEDQVTKIGNEHRIVTCRDDAADRECVCVFLKLEENSLFVAFEIGEGGEMKHVATVQSPSNDNDSLTTTLVDFKLSPDDCLWVMTVNADDQMALSVCNIHQQNWHEVALDNLPSQELSPVAHMTVRETFIDELFMSGKFSHRSIAKALAIATRSSVVCNTTEELRASVIAHLEEEVSNLLENTSTFEEVNGTQLSVFSTFYRTCLQYQLYFSRPVGFSLPAHDGVDVVKKDHISYLSPVPDLEAVCLGVQPSVFKDVLPEAGSNLEDFGKLLHCLSNLSLLLGEELIDDMMQSLPFTESPNDCVETHLPNIRQIISSARSEEFEDGLVSISDFLSAVGMLVSCLDPSPFEPEGVDQENMCGLNEEGIELLARSFSRYIKDRLRLSLLLFILTIHVDEIRGMVSSQVALHVQAYTALNWIASAETEYISRGTLEVSLQNLSVHEMLSTTQQLQQNAVVSRASLLYYYLKCDGSRLLSSFINFNGVLTKQLIPKATAAITKVLWPLGPTFAFPQFLLQNAQYSNLEHYLGHMLQPWCKYQPSFTSYLLAQCHLNNGHYDKAVDGFIGAVELVHEDEHFLAAVLGTVSDSTSRFDIQMLYFNKVIDLFEQLELSEQVIRLAKCAITFSLHDDKSLALRYSTTFRQCLALERYEQAFWAIASNPNYDYRKNCLRSLVIKLFENREYKKLVEFSYGDMQNEFVGIMEERARSCEVPLTSHPTQYDLLHAFHIFRKNYRRAATMMYEQYWRLMTDAVLNANQALQSLHRQHQCLVVTVSCLLLVDQENQYVVHRCDYLNNTDKSKNGSSIIIKEAADIQKEIMLMGAKMKLARDASDLLPNANHSPSETVALLTHAAYYDDAFTISRKFDLKMKSIFRAVATRCVYSSYLDSDEVRKWLKKNKNDVQLGHGFLKPADSAWLLLKKYLHEMATNEDYRAVLDILLGFRAHLPTWFINIYKKLNCPELIRSLICYDYLELATKLSVDFVNGVLGVRPADFGIRNTLLKYKHPVWLPRNEIQMLINLLEEKQSEEDQFFEMYESLCDKMEEYTTTLKKLEVH